MAATQSSTKRGTGRNDPPPAQHLDIEEIDRCVSKALGVAMALSERNGDEHDANAAETIVDNLYAAKRLLEGGVNHG